MTIVMPGNLHLVSGLSMDEFQDALKLWKTVRDHDKYYTFPEILWRLGCDTNIIGIRCHYCGQKVNSEDEYKPCQYCGAPL
jgi:DNA-directed RNA polymerase subunit RPC12/RpoP